MSDQEQLAVSIARLETKVDGINARLDRLNGSVASLQTASNDHENQLVVLNTEKDLFVKIGKPVLLALCVIVAGMVGHDVNLSQLLELFK